MKDHPTIPTPGVYYRHWSWMLALRDELAVERGFAAYGVFDPEIVEEPAAERQGEMTRGDTPEWEPGEVARLEAFENEVPEVYAERLKSILDRDLGVSKAKTNPQDPRKVGGPGIEFDLVRLVVEATAIGGGYLVWKEVAKDVRAAVRRLRLLSGQHVLIDEGSAIVLAVDALAPPGAPAALEVRFVAPLRVPSGADDRRPVARGYLVGLQVGGQLAVVAIDADGRAAGVGQLDGIDLGGMGL